MNNYISLFSGVGGIDLGFDRAGWKCVGQVEKDNFCQKVLAHHWPDVERHDDVKTAVEWWSESPRPGVTAVTAGFPCQDVSKAGRRAGLSGNRTGLFFDAVEFTASIGATWFLLENVPGLLTSNNGRDFAVVLTTLAEWGYSYREWRVLDSQYFGVPQHRRRVIIVAGVDKPVGGPILFEPSSGGGDSPEESATRTSVARRTTISTLQGSGDRGCEGETGQLRIGTEVDPHGVGAPARISRSLDSTTVYRKAKRPQNNQDDETWVKESLSNTLNAFDVGDSRATSLVLQRTALITADQDPLPDSPRYRTMGNAVTVNVAEWVARRLLNA